MLSRHQYIKSSIPRLSGLRRTFSTSRVTDPLHILFCGSDGLSISSLEALQREYKRNPGLIRSIDVVCKPAKRTGRGLKTVREVPIAAVARALSLPLHEIDTFTGWQPPTPLGEQINLVIAVSFGLLIPPRILGKAKYGGLNVHPSLLPDFRGAAPLHHTLLHNTEMTGVSLQTLHPTKFDHGMVLAQTPEPGIKHGCTSVPELMTLLAPKGAELLVEGIKQGIHVPPLKEVGWCKTEKEIQKIRRAPKIKPSDRHIDWASWTADDITRRHRVIGPLWNFANASHPERAHSRRVIWTSGFRMAEAGRQLSSNAGHPVVTSFKTDQDVYIKTCDGQILQADEVKLDGERNMRFLSAARRAGMVDMPTGPLQYPVLFRQGLQ